MQLWDYAIQDRNYVTATCSLSLRAKMPISLLTEDFGPVVGSCMRIQDCVALACFALLSQYWWLKLDIYFLAQYLRRELTESSCVKSVPSACNVSSTVHTTHSSSLVPSHGNASSVPCCYYVYVCVRQDLWAQQILFELGTTSNIAGHDSL